MASRNEEARLDALHQLRLLDTPPSEAFDRITRMASRIFNLPVAAVSLTDKDRQWFKSRVGVDHTSIPRDKAPCSAVAESTESLMIPDLLADPRYANSLLGQNGTRFYAGAPLITREGHGLGALCVLGGEPRTASAEEMNVLRDLAAMVMAQIEMQHAFGRIDPVSGMPNRNQFLDDLNDLAGEGSGTQRIAVLIDLARHDQVNAIVRVLGAARVDDMVQETAQALRKFLGADRIVYHVAATQFAFLAPPDTDITEYMETIGAGFSALRSVSETRFVTTVAVGVMPFTLGKIAPGDVLRGAHSAAQDARGTDGAIALHSARSDKAHARQFELIEEFGKAIEQGDQLRLVFQPRIDLASGRCVGAEALMRWRHPVLGEIPPGEFIPLVEQTSLIRGATDWVIENGIRQLGAWHAAGLDLSLSLNVSATNLDEHDLVQRIQLHLLKHRVPAHRLEVEVTESALMTDGHALACLGELAATGVRIAIDDFGAGYSSLAYLQKLPAHVVKIDQSFVRELTSAATRESKLVEMVIVLGHQLNYRIVAEGVETRDAAAVLRSLGCEEAQGFLFARPMDVAAFNGWYAEQGHRAHAAAA